MTITKVAFSPLDPLFVRDPYAVYRALRDEDPVHQSPQGFWVLTRYADVAAALRDDRLSNRPAPFSLMHGRNRHKFLAAGVANNLIAFEDAPEHTVPRRVMATTFQAFIKGTGPLLSNLARDLAHGLAQRIDRDGTADFVADFAIPYATRSVCRVMGFPESDAERLKAWSGEFFFLFHAIPDKETFTRLNQSLAEFRAYVEAAVEARAADPRDDLISVLAASDAHGFSRDELVDNVMLLAADGVENVQAGLASALMTLLEHPGAMDEAMASPRALETAIDECLRLESPGQYQGRIVTQPTEIGGRLLRSHSVVLVGLAAANRDPEVFDAPDSFRPGRPGPRHLAFGLGRHACLGGSMVRMEFAAALSALNDLPRRLALAPATPDWMARAGHRWLRHLPVRLEG